MTASSKNIRIYRITQPGRLGERIVGYDNEAGKGDHRHRRSVEDAYEFTTVEQLIADFMADVQRERDNQP